MNRQKTAADVSIDSLYSPLLDLKTNFVWMKYCMIGRGYNTNICVDFVKKFRKLRLLKKYCGYQKMFENMLYVYFQTFFYQYHLFLVKRMKTGNFF